MTPPSDGHGRDAAGRLFGLLLALFPAEFRNAYGGEMREVFAAQRHAARAAGIRARTRLWARTVAGMTIAAWRERRPRHETASNAWNPVLRWPAATLAEIGYAVRRLARARGYACAVVATLALCIGANLTIFAAVDAILLRGLPFPDAARLLTIYNTYPRAGVPDDGASVANYYERRTGIAAFSSVSLYKTEAVIVGDTGSTEREPVMRVSPEFFTTLGVTPMLGRVFREEETTPATAGVVVLSEPYWREQLAGDRTVIGRSIRINGARHTIVGVLPAGFTFLGSRARLFLPYASAPDDRRSARRHSGSASQMIARLAPGVTLDEAQRQIDAHNGITEREDPDRGMMIQAGFRSVVVSLHSRHVETVRPSLLLVQAGALVLFAIGLVNVGNLFLVRAGSRTKELAVRRAIGARTSHIAGSVLAETLLLSACGALAGLVVAEAGVGLLGTLGASRLPLGSQITLDATSIVAAAAAALLAGLILGAVTTAHQCATDAGDVLRSETRGATAGRRSERARHAIVVAQVALSFVLLASAVLLTSSVRRLMLVSPGFDSGQLFTAQVTLPFPRYETDAALRSFVDRLVRELAMVPGLSASGIATNVPLSGNAIKSAASIFGRPVRPGEPPHGVYAYAVAGEFFAAMKVPLHEGRYLRPSDAGAGARACVVDETFARAHWPSGGAVGQRLFLGSSEGPIDEAYTIVGVVGEVKQASLSERDGNGAVYYPYSDRFDRAIYIVTRTTVPPDSIQSAVRQVVRRIDPELPLNNARSMDARIDDSLIAQRSPAVFGLVFSGVALALTALGTFGAISYAIAQRRREIGVRLALGARPRQVGAQFLVLGARLLAAGLTLGLGGWWAVSRALAAWLAGMPSAPASATVLATAVMGTVCVLACAIPARRAMRISPIDALQE